MHLPALITDLAIMLLTAGVVTVIFKKIRLPLVLGYIAAGFLIGPHMPFFFTVTDSASISTWSEIGIIILMFCLGLEFNLHKLAETGGSAILTTITEVGGMLVVGYFVGQALGWNVMNSIFLGGMLAMSSTIIVIKVFDDLDLRKKKFAQTVFGSLVMQDIVGIFMMIVLSTVSVEQSVSGGALAAKLATLVLYLALWLLLGIYLLPTLLNRASRLMNDETLLIVSLGICFGMVLLADALGFSTALGAFLAGSLLACTVHGERVEHLTSGVKDLFGSVFFLSVGMMLAPSMVAAYIVPILIITAVTIVGKIAFSGLGVLLSGGSLLSAVSCGCSLAQIGEFAFIIASLGLSLGVTSDFLYPIIVSVSVITTLTTPFCIKGAGRITALTERLLPKKLAEKLARYSGGTDEEAEAPRDNDWVIFLRRYIRVTLIYGVIMLGIVIIGRVLLLPLLESLPLAGWISRAICIAVIYLAMAIFIRPMLDFRSTQYTTLWVKNRAFRLPLMALAAIRLLIIVLIAFIPLQTVAGLTGLWLLPIIAAAALLIARSSRLSSAYLRVEAQFLANFNERQLQQDEASGNSAGRLDEALLVQAFTYTGERQTLLQTGWGRRFGVNVIKIIRGRRHKNMPSGDSTVAPGDRIYLLGEADALRSFRIGMNLKGLPDALPLRQFIETEHDADHDLYAYALSVEKGSPLAGTSIRDSGIRDNYDCMILGLQRSRLPIIQPDINMVIQSGDLVWILGTRTMAAKLLKTEE
ncbi:MAG: cation:proton antiporter [Oscillospiraceae bacterium]|nr:cation:proton antiporter [Oscillospiraceae bacterium]